jgi:hypothetical protein
MQNSVNENKPLATANINKRCSSKFFAQTQDPKRKNSITPYCLIGSKATP